MFNVVLAFTPRSLITDVTYLTTEEWANETLQLLATLFVITPFVAISGFFMFKTCASVPRPGSCPAPFQIPPPALPAVHALMLSAVLFGSRSASNSDVVCTCVITHRHALLNPSFPPPSHPALHDPFSSSRQNRFPRRNPCAARSQTGSTQKTTERD